MKFEIDGTPAHQIYNLLIGLVSGAAHRLGDQHR